MMWAALLLALTAWGSPVDVVYALLQRRIPHHTKFELHLASEETEERFRVENGKEDGRIKITGSTMSAITSGIHSYLKRSGASIAWDALGGDNFDALDSGLPPVECKKYEHSTDLSLRYYLNTCTYGYSLAWWDWNRWEKEIDWMALHGINAPLSMTGVEYIWKQVFEQDFDYGNVTVSDFFVGPAFLPWHWMGNIDGWAGPLTDKFLESQRKLQHRILQRMRSLGMKPILPSFAGFVPKAMKKLFPSIVKDSSGWGGFPPTHYVEPTTALFAEISIKFQKRYCEEYGCYEHLYTCDLYNELLPPSSSIFYLQNVSSSVYNVMKKTDSDAVWITQGWMFLNEPGFWKNRQIKAFIRGVPQGKLIIIDLDAASRPVFPITHNFFGAPFIFSMVSNFGGRPGIFGTKTRMTQRLKQARATGNLIGIGVAPEAIETDVMIYELFFDHVWTEDIDFKQWLPRFVDQRYGHRSWGGAREAWKLLVGSGIYDSVYSEASPLTFHVRPTLTLVREPDYDVRALRHAAQVLARRGADPSSAYAVDVAFISVQALSVTLRTVHRNCGVAYRILSIDKFRFCKEQFMMIMNSIDFLASFWLPAEKQLTHWLASASQASGSDSRKDKRFFRWNARRQITLWGPQNSNLHDYSARLFGGLTSEFYIPRWKLFFDFLETAIRTRAPFDQAGCDAKLKDFEERWADADDDSWKQHVPIKNVTLKDIVRMLEDNFDPQLRPETADKVLFA